MRQNFLFDFLICLSRLVQMQVQLLAALILIIACVLRSSLEHGNAFLIHGFKSNGTTPSPARVLLVTAHPDDESLFFAPTVISLLSHKKKNKATPCVEVYLLCLSTGNADGSGKIRQGEIQRASDVLGIEDVKRWVVDNPCGRLNRSTLRFI
jgi:N-acetylglucosaminylphosphatidylinositol deacetylase